MKKVLIALAVVVVIIVGGVVLLFSNLDSIVEAAIETAGSNAVGSRVEVGSVDLDLTAGSAAIYDFSVANPSGYSARDMIRFDELSVALNLINTSGENLHITSVVARSPYVLYETIDGVSNLDKVSARFESEESSEPSEDSSSQIMLVIDSILIENIQGTLISDKLPSDVNVDLGDIRLTDLEGYPEDLAGQIMAPLLSQISVAGAQAMVQATRELLSNSTEALGEAGIQLQDSVDDVADKANDALESVGNLFRRGGDDD